MKRRFFLRDVSLGGASFLVPGKSPEGSDKRQWNDYSYGEVSEFSEVINKDGFVRLRIAFSASEQGQSVQQKGKLKVKNCKINRVNNYFFEQDDVFDMDRLSWESNSITTRPDVLLVSLGETMPHSAVIIQGEKGLLQFSLDELVKSQQYSGRIDGVSVEANFLLDREIDELKPGQIGIKDDKDDFRFVIMADPQGGDPKEEGNVSTRMKIHNAFAEDSITLINKLKPKPAFTLILGDIVDSQGQKANFVQMHQYFERLDTPILYEVGNHETRYRSEFTPGYNMEAFNNFFTAQKEINGLELMLYSFNMGKWHFIVWPDPLRTNFWETHPHYFEWLETDLERYKDRPTVFLQHVPMHPIGINPLINYAESVSVKRMLLDLLARHGNVKYVFSGHVHIPVKASFKTAVSYRGMNMINLPPAGYRPRGFGEEDFFGGPSQGILIVDIKGDELRATFRTVTEETFVYPNNLPAFDEEKFSLWLKHKWELPSSNVLNNGNFESGLKHWYQRYVYREDENPSNICEIRRKPSDASYSSLYLFCRKRGYDAPGQDRLAQTINRICQPVQIQPGKIPSISLKYMIDGKNSCMDGWCGAYVWIEGFNKSSKKLNLAYWAGAAYAGIGGKYNDSQILPPVNIELIKQTDIWHNFTADLEADISNNLSGSDLQNANLDKLVINLGVWTVNDGREQPFAVYLNDIELNYDYGLEGSAVDGVLLRPMPDEKTWWMGKYTKPTHVAGEHRIVFETQHLLGEI